MFDVSFDHIWNVDSTQLPIFFVPPHSRDLRFYSRMKDLDRISTCSKWPPGAFGKNCGVSTSSETKTKLKGSSKYKNKNPDVALLCFTVRESSQCWIYDDF